MKITDFVLYKKYKITDLMEAFENKAFIYGQGMIYTVKTNNLVLISRYTKGRIYQDKIENGIIHYTGMGQVGDQQLALGNKRLANAKQDNTTVYMFLVYKDGEFTYYGRVSLDDPYYFEDELDRTGNLRKVYKFPLRFVDAMAPLSTDEIATHVVSGNVQTINVVGAAIINDGKILCAQRGHGKALEGKWEFAGGKVEQNETNEQALVREIKEELDADIEVGELVDVSKHYDGFRNIVLSVYKAKLKNCEPKNNEHKELMWVPIEEIESLDWAPNDIPIVQTIIDSLPRKIVDVVDYDYKQAEKKLPKSKEIKRTLQDYEKSQKSKTKSGAEAEDAVIDYEIKKLTSLGRIDLANQIEQVSKISSDFGYDIKSFEKFGDKFEELHIEVKSATKVGDKIEFFISQAELRNCVDDENFRIYALIKHGKNYQLHIVKNKDFLLGNYCSPITFKVSIPIQELKK